ncbi:MAG: ABC-F family ATP-binding cassette domain-containing protein [Saprospiraceae bacterium]|nr:ABC-F family ATP-binding cassette domain-containing protein [Saprospiraceae bacterium]MBP7643961.1 ABC-F family ATP-binding cassette domain-containing protein [Saprospiraceae bacterium]
MVYISDVSLHFGDRTLLDGISFLLNEKERVGLVGRNGAGKSTLLKIISGQINSDTGGIQAPKGYTIGYLKQDLLFEDNLSVMDEVKKCFVEYNALSNEVDQIGVEIGERTDYESDAYHDLLVRMAEINDRLHIISPGNLDAEVEKILKGLGFKVVDFEKRMREFSGGWQMRVELAKLLLTKPNLLMLDEPTNHLDIESIIWLENYLKTYPGIVVIISHDKRFLNNSCNKIIELELGRANIYNGNYNFYLSEKAANRDILMASYANQQKMLAQKEKTINRFMAKATKTSMAQSMQKQLDKVERIEIPQEDTEVFNIKFPKAPHSGRIVIEAQNVSKSFGDKKVLENLNFTLEKGDKIAFVGKNGMGKTTMSKIIVGQLSPTSGQVNYGANVEISYYAQNQAELLDMSKTALQVMEDSAPPEQRSKVRSILGAFLFSGDDSGKKVSVLSGGERARLAMACMVMKPGNLLILDEPTNHLDILSKEILQNAIKTFDGTLIIVSHDREFLEGLTEKVMEFHENGITEYLGDINYFLSKKNYADVREIDQTNGKASVAVNPVKVLDQNELKQIKRKIQYLERDIEEKEKKINDLNLKMSDAQFYLSPDFAKSSAQLKTLQEEHSTLMVTWENLVETLGE